MAQGQHLVTVLLLAALVALASSPGAAARKIVFCTDIGSDIDDAWALAFALQSPELDVDCVVVSHGPTVGRAKLAAKLLSIAGRDDVPVIVGKPSKWSSESGQRKWAADFIHRKPPVSGGARALARRLLRMQGKATLVPTGPLTDIGELLDLKPKVKDKIDEIILMGGAAFRGYGRDPNPCAEYNIASDVRAAQAVFASGVPIVMLGLDVTAMMQPGSADMKRVAESDKTLARALHELFLAWGHPMPTFFDAVAVATAFRRDLVKLDHVHVEVTDDGITRIVPGGEPNCHVGVAVDKPQLMKLFFERILR